jgi:polyhydroxyalkanoate synthesis regulator phasin
MIEFVKKTLMAGVGLAALTRDKVEELGKELAAQAKLSEQEGKKLIADLVQRSEQARNDLNGRVEKLVAQTLEKMHLPTRESIDQLKQRVEALERKLAEHQSSAHPHAAGE